MISPKVTLAEYCAIMNFNPNNFCKVLFLTSLSLSIYLSLCLCLCMSLPLHPPSPSTLLSLLHPSLPFSQPTSTSFSPVSLAELSLTVCFSLAFYGPTESDVSHSTSRGHPLILESREWQRDQALRDELSMRTAGT